MDVDEVAKEVSVPGFLRKVLRGELSDDNGDAIKHHKILMMIAVHAVLLDSGLVPFDSISNAKIDHFPLSDDRCAVSGLLGYTLPQLIHSGSEKIESVSLRFESLGNFIIVYGSLTREGSEVRKLRLDGHKYAPAIGHVVWTTPFRPTLYNSKSLVLEFWRIAKDMLALPLLIDLCDRTGLILPACFKHLPAELKLKILEFLPGVDLARVGCVSTELRHLSSNDELWKMKFQEEYGHRVVSMWKLSFGVLWERDQKEKLRASYSTSGYFLPGRGWHPPPYCPIRRYQEPLRLGRNMYVPYLGFRDRSVPRHKEE